MFNNTDRLLKIQNAIKEVVRQLAELPAQQAQRVDKVIERCQQCLKNAPDTDLPVYIHITGTDKSFKTSYLLDLFDNDELRKFFAVKQRNTSENTAVPCLVEPVSWTDEVVVSQLSISTGNVIRDRLTKEQFNRLYDLSSGADPDDYLIRVAVPENQTPMNLPVIEYPGIKEGADAVEFQKERHEKFQANMLDCLERYPGILVACFPAQNRHSPGPPLRCHPEKIPYGARDHPCLPEAAADPVFARATVPWPAIAATPMWSRTLKAILKATKPLTPWCS